MSVTKILILDSRGSPSFWTMVRLSPRTGLKGIIPMKTDMPIYFQRFFHIFGTYMRRAESAQSTSVTMITVVLITDQGIISVVYQRKKIFSIYSYGTVVATTFVLQEVLPHTGIRRM
jgi:hypothetical protein